MPRRCVMWLTKALRQFRIVCSHLTGKMRDESQAAKLPPLVCFCHLRWNFVYQRPQHLMTQWGESGPVYFFEEPVFSDVGGTTLTVTEGGRGVRVLTPTLPHGLTEQEIVEAQRSLVGDYLKIEGISNFVAWYYTPMALRFSSHLKPIVTVYDCMDELSAFQGAPPEMLKQEQHLFELADVVFAGGKSLYESKRRQHANVHLFPSSIDKAHFARGRQPLPNPPDQQSIAQPRIGFYGVLDERLDIELMQQLAALRPDWHFVLLGPVVKIRQEDLPHAPNLHYLGSKSYADLPQYLANWDVAILPFARNAATRFISPTKTPEYLAAGKPVISTPIQDVVQPYGEMGLVRIAENSEQFVEAIAASLQPIEPAHDRRVNAFLAEMSWNKTFSGMLKEINKCGPGVAVSSVLTGPPGTIRGNVANV